MPHVIKNVPCVFAAADCVDPDVPVLAGGEHVLAVRVHLHVVQRRLPHHVVAARELGKAAVGGHLPEYDGLVRTTTASGIRIRLFGYDRYHVQLMPFIYRDQLYSALQVW